MSSNSALDQSVAEPLIPEDLNPQGYTSLNDFVDNTLGQFAERPAFTSLNATLTYAEIDRWSTAFAAYIQSETSLKLGDRIAIQLPNLIQYPIVVYGALRAGLVIVNTNPLYTADEMLYQFRDSGAKYLIIHSSMAYKAQKILDQTDIEQVLTSQIGDFCPRLSGFMLNWAIKYLKRMEPVFDIPGSINLRCAIQPFLGKPIRSHVARLEDIFALQYTGGTTGVPKGAVLTHANVLANILQGEERMQGVSDDWTEQVISPLPLYHIYAFMVAQIVAAKGGHSVLIPNPRDLPGLVKTLRRWRPTTFIGLNTLFIGLANQPDIDRVDFSRLRLTLSGGMTLTHQAERLWYQITGRPIVDAYGLTEASPAVATTLPLEPRVGSIGLPLAHTQCQILKEDQSFAAIGEAGELIVKGPQVMREYWKQPEETRQVFTEHGFLRTGDIARRDAEGYLQLIDRAKDIIIVSGFNVYPAELENKICDHPQVRECAVVGVPDEKQGEAVRLFIVATDEALDAPALEAWCRLHFAAYKCPKDIRFVNELPKTPVGKVLRRLLRDQT